MTKKLFTLPLLFAIIALFFAQAEAGKHGRHGKGHRMMKHLEALDLSEDQKTKLGEIREHSKEKKQVIKKKVRAAREQLQKAFFEDRSESELKSLREVVKSARSEMGDHRFEKILAIRKILTPEQRKKFHELRADHKKLKEKKYRHEHSEEEI